MRRSIGMVLCVALMLWLMGCGGLRYSQVDPEAKDFHPERVGVLPVDVGSNEEARVVDQIITGVLAEKKWFKDVVAADSMKSLLTFNEAFRRDVLEYLSKFKTVNFSDPELSRKIGDTGQMDAFLVVTVDYWNYTRENDKKVAKVGLGMKLVNARTGKVLWKAVHYEAESYMLIKPDLADVAKSLVKTMIAEMPH